MGCGSYPQDQRRLKMYDLETTSADEMMIGVAQRLSQINNVLMPKLDSLAFRSTEQKGRLLAVYHSLANAEETIMEYIRDENII